MVGLGTWGHGGENTNDGRSVGWSGHDDDEAKTAMRVAFEGGIDHWDTADVYGDGRAEALIGSMWNEIDRDRIFLATKVGWDRGTHDHFYAPSLMRERLDRSLRLLRTDHVDLYYLHHCDFGPGDQHLEGALEVLAEARQAGKIRFTGLSDWDPAKVTRLIDVVDPDVVQPYRNVVDDAWETSGLRHAVGRKNLGVAFFSPIKHGLLLGKYERPVEFPEGDFRRNVEEFGDPSFIARMQDARKKMEARFEGVAEPVLHGLIGALVEDAPTASVLLGQRNERQARAATRIGDALTAEDAAWVRELYAAER